MRWNETHGVSRVFKAKLLSMLRSENSSTVHGYGRNVLKWVMVYLTMNKIMIMRAIGARGCFT